MTRERMLARAAIAGFAVGRDRPGRRGHELGRRLARPSPRDRVRSGGREQRRRPPSRSRRMPSSTGCGAPCPTFPSRPGRGPSGETATARASRHWPAALGLAAPVKDTADGWTVTDGRRSLRVAPVSRAFRGTSGPTKATATSRAWCPPSPPGTTPPAPDTPVASDAVDRAARACRRPPRRRSSPVPRRPVRPARSARRSRAERPTRSPPPNARPISRHASRPKPPHGRSW